MDLMNTEPKPLTHLKALVRLQEMAAPVLRQRGRNVQPWRIGGPLETP